MHRIHTPLGMLLVGCVVSVLATVLSGLAFASGQCVQQFGNTYGSSALEALNALNSENVPPDSKPATEVLKIVDTAIQDLTNVMNTSTGMDSASAVDIRWKLSSLLGTKAYQLNRAGESKTLIAAYYSLAGAMLVEATMFTKDANSRQGLFARAASEFQFAGCWELSRHFSQFGPPAVPATIIENR